MAPKWNANWTRAWPNEYPGRTESVALISDFPTDPGVLRDMVDDALRERDKRLEMTSSRLLDEAVVKITERWASETESLVAKAVAAYGLPASELTLCRQMKGGVERVWVEPKSVSDTRPWAPRPPDD